MSHEFRHICQVETRRLLWLMGLAFAMILIVQYFELPYGNVISSLFSGGKARVPVIGSSPPGDLTQNPKMLGNPALDDGLNSTDANSIHEIANMTKKSEGKDIGLKNDFESERNGGLDDSLELDEDGDPEDESSSENFERNQNSTMEKIERNNGLAPNGFSANNSIADNDSSLSSMPKEASEKLGSVDASPAVPLFSLPPISSLPPLTFPTNVDAHSRPPVISFNPNTSSPDKYADNNEKPGPLQSDLALLNNVSSITGAPPVKERSESPTEAVVSISKMNDMLLQSRTSSHSMKPRWSSAVDKQLQNAKSQIENAPLWNDPGLYAPLYRNVSMFRRSYELMEQTLKVYIYKEGERPIFHQAVLKGIYASEGWFMKLLKANRRYVTKNPRKAHLFYLPFSSRMLEETLYVPNSHSHKNLVQYLKNYLDMIVAKYPFWNRTGGADHFLVACHDWAPSETDRHMANCIRALCNADVKEGFKLGKDVSLPETYVRSAQNPLRELGGKPMSQRPILAFFAGGMHGYLRPRLLQYWENKDPDMKIFGQMPKVKGNKNYIQHMKSSKYCICAKGYEVNSPRVVEAIFYECVPVILSDNFVPPFFEVLNWESFAVFVPEKDIPNLKNILLSISNRRYLAMRQRVKQVQQHFLWHARPVKYDIFHMILHSIWYNRVFQIRPR